MRSAATEEWNYPPILPNDPKRICLVEAEHTRSHVRTLYLVRYFQSQWRFPDRNELSRELAVLRWAYVLQD